MEFAATAAQQELWYLDQIASAGAALNVAVAWRLTGPLSEHALDTAVRALIQGHAALRCSFLERDGGLWTVVGPLPGSCLVVEEVVAEKEAQRLSAFAEKPFDLATGPPFRALLLRESANEHVLALCFHHIVVDAWSLDIIEHDLSRAYAGEAIAAAPLEDAARALNARRGQQREADDLDYWADQLRAASETGALTSATSYAETADFRAHIRQTRLDPGTARRLTALARRLGATPFQLLFAVCVGVLARRENRDDLIVTVPVSDRTDAQVRPALLFATNLLPIRVRLAPDTSCRGLVDEVRERLLDAIDHGSVSLSQILRRCGVQEGRQLSGLSDVVVTYQARGSQCGPDFSNVRTERLALDTPHSLYRLALHSEVVSDQDIRIDLRGKSADQGMLDRLRLCLAATFEAVARDPDLPVADWPTLMPDEVPGPPAAVRAPELVPNLLLGTSELLPGHTAVEAKDEILTYWQLRRRALDLAARLSGAGAERGEIVAVCVSRSADLPIALHGVLLAGCVYLPIDSDWPNGRIRAIIADSGAQFIICDDATRSLPAFGTAIRIPARQEHTANLAAVPSVIVRSDDAAYLIYTSGSSGAPKGVVVEHAALAALLAAMRELAQANSIGRILASTSPAFDISFVELLLPAALGATCVVADDETAHDPMLLAEYIAARNIDLVQATPSFWSLLVEHLRVRVSVAVTTGEPLPEKLRDLLADVSDRAFNAYGPTEATIWATVWELESGAGVSIGTPLPGVAAWVLDRWNKPCASGTVGRLFLAGTGLARGYLEADGTLTASRFLPAPPGLGTHRVYATGDLASRSADGLLYLHGREDDQIKIRGNRVELGEIEAIVEAVEGVTAATAVVLSQGDGRRVLAAFVQPADQDGPRLTADLDRRIHAALKEQLPGAVRPRLLVPVEALPLLSSGKVDRKALAAQAWEVPASSDALPKAPAFADEVLAVVTESFTRILSVSEVNAEADFFSIGGDSLSAARLITEIRKRFGVPVSLRTFFSGPTVAELASVIRSGLPGRSENDR